MPATPAQFHSTFATDDGGAAVLEHLIEKFGKAPFVAGMPDQTAFNCGTKAVIEDILSMISEFEHPMGKT